MPPLRGAQCPAQHTSMTSRRRPPQVARSVRQAVTHWTRVSACSQRFSTLAPCGGDEDGGIPGGEWGHTGAVWQSGQRGWSKKGCTTQEQVHASLRPSAAESPPPHTTVLHSQQQQADVDKLCRLAQVAPPHCAGLVQQPPLPAPLPPVFAKVVGPRSITVVA